FPSPVDTDFLLNVDYLQAKILSRQIISGELILAHYFFSHAKFNSFRNHRFLYLVTSNQANMLKKDVSDLKSSGLLKEILDNTNKNYETMPSLKNYYETFFPVKLSLDTLSDAKFVGSVEAHVSSFLNTVYSGRMYNFFTFPPRIRLYEKGFGRFF
ncbi:MAG: hypothetical protein KKC26_08475, partial [Nanoarchaeota archaeon]|nr:hypothetical protein [Nanoarchaeota archaeon]MBU1850149.1 hypothetical protein [Nanoarchaeota archaeon]